MFIRAHPRCASYDASQITTDYLNAASPSPAYELQSSPLACPVRENQWNLPSVPELPAKITGTTRRSGQTDQSIVSSCPPPRFAYQTRQLQN